MLKNGVIALSSLSNFLVACRAVMLDDLGLTVELQSFSKQVENWLRTHAAEKRLYKADLRVSNSDSGRMIEVNLT